jgi:hypothetical protein
MCTWDRASEPHEKRLKNLAIEIAKSQGDEVASFGTSDIGSRRRSCSTSRVAKLRGSEVAIAWKSQEK